MIRAIFSINPGRSGSHYLSWLLAAAGNCESYHERSPSGFGTEMRAFQRGDVVSMEKIAREKAREVAHARDRGVVYADTTHAFIKGFGWSLMTLLDPSEVGIIILKRGKAQVVESTAKVWCLPLNDVGRTYILAPDRGDPIRTPPKFGLLPGRSGYLFARGIHDMVWKSRGLRRRLGVDAPSKPPLLEYQTAAIDWYWEETYALGAKFKERFPDCKYLDVNVEALNRPEVVKEVFTLFDLEPGSDLAARVGRATNLRP